MCVCVVSSFGIIQCRSSMLVSHESSCGHDAFLYFFRPLEYQYYPYMNTLHPPFIDYFSPIVSTQDVPYGVKTPMYFYSKAYGCLRILPHVHAADDTPGTDTRLEDLELALVVLLTC